MVAPSTRLVGRRRILVPFGPRILGGSAFQRTAIARKGQVLSPSLWRWLLTI